MTEQEIQENSQNAILECVLDFTQDLCGVVISGGTISEREQDFATVMNCIRETQQQLNASKEIVRSFVRLIFIKFAMYLVQSDPSTYTSREKAVVDALQMIADDELEAQQYLTN